MASLCKAIIIGNLGRDPEMRYTPSGKAVTTFSVATNRRFTTESGETREETTWIRVTAWNQLAERCSQYLTKGRSVYVEGRLQPRTWTGNDGVQRTEIEVVAQEVVFLGGPRGAESSEVMAGVGGGSRQPDEIDPDDLPF